MEILLMKSEKVEWHFWYSEKQMQVQKEIDMGYDKPKKATFALINGKVKEYSECHTVMKKSGWDDAVYLGKGVWV